MCILLIQYSCTCSLFYVCMVLFHALLVYMDYQHSINKIVLDTSLYDLCTYCLTFIDAWYIMIGCLSFSSSPSFPGKVFTQLQHLLRPLSLHLLSCKLSGGATVTSGDSGGDNASDSDSKVLVLMEEFRAVCGDGPVEMLVRQCLKPSVPTNQKHLEKYRSVVTDTEKLEVHLPQVSGH